MLFENDEHLNKIYNLCVFCALFGHRMGRGREGIAASIRLQNYYYFLQFLKANTMKTIKIACTEFHLVHSIGLAFIKCTVAIPRIDRSLSINVTTYNVFEVQAVDCAQQIEDCNFPCSGKRRETIRCIAFSLRIQTNGIRCFLHIKIIYVSNGTFSEINIMRSAFVSSVNLGVVFFFIPRTRPLLSACILHSLALWPFSTWSFGAKRCSIRLHFSLKLKRFWTNEMVKWDPSSTWRWVCAVCVGCECVSNGRTRSLALVQIWNFQWNVLSTRNAFI